jgi:hypothetical protein
VTGWERIQALIGRPAFAVLDNQRQHYGRCIGWRRGSVAVADQRGMVRVVHGRYVRPWVAWDLQAIGNK